MSKRSIASFLSTWLTQFASNGIRAITGPTLQDFRKDIADSFLNLTDNAYNGVAGWKNGVNTIAVLKALPTTTLQTGIALAFRDTGNSDALRYYELVSGTTAESSPTVIRPTDYDGTTNQKVWKLAILNSGNVGKGYIGEWDLSSGLLPGGTATYLGNFWKIFYSDPGDIGTIVGKDGGAIPAGSMLIASKDNPKSDPDDDAILDYDIWYTVQPSLT